MLEFVHWLTLPQLFFQQRYAPPQAQTPFFPIVNFQCSVQAGGEPTTEKFKTKQTYQTGHRCALKGIQFERVLLGHSACPTRLLYRACVIATVHIMLSWCSMTIWEDLVRLKQHNCYSYRTIPAASRGHRRSLPVAQPHVRSLQPEQ